jgi:hypothetical protein
MLVNKTLPMRWSPPMRASRRAHARKACAFLALTLAATMWTGVPAVVAQDVQGIELCTRETRLDRRTGCLQSNVEYLQQLIAKNALDSQQKLAARIGKSPRRRTLPPPLPRRSRRSKTRWPACRAASRGPN